MIAGLEVPETVDDLAVEEREPELVPVTAGVDPEEGVDPMEEDDPTEGVDPEESVLEDTLPPPGSPVIEGPPVTVVVG